MSVSDPRSKQYGQHWTSQQVADYFAPEASTIEVVRSWILNAGAKDVRLSRGRNWLKMTLRIVEVEALLEAEYYELQHETGARKYGKAFCLIREE